MLGPRNAGQMMAARLKLTDGFRHVTTKPADLAGHCVACGCASPVQGRQANNSFLVAMQISFAQPSAAAVNDS